MANITYYPSNDSKDCNQKAILPVVHQHTLVFAETEGDTATDLMPALATGEITAFGGSVTSEGCYDVQLDITYLEGDDCDSCTVDTLTPSVVTIVVPKGQGFTVLELPNGAIQQIQATLLDAAGAAVALPVGKDHKLRYDNCYQPCCGRSIPAV